ncbi:MAG: amidinotransferase [Anaerolineae bacterium]|nr:amidinotransferase [Anaerolineae bacterium]
MVRQHTAYVDALRAVGLEVTVLDAQEAYPDSYFVEDTAVVTPEVAVIARPGALARRGEERTIEPLLAHYREIARIQAPGTLEGGDVLIVDGQVYIGLSTRTNEEGARQLGETLARRGYAWRTVPVDAGLHLKSGANYLGHDTVLVSQSLADAGALAAHRQIVVDPDEAYAGNVLWINGTVFAPAGYPRTRRQIEALGLPVVALDVSEMHKMDGGLTCLSIRF